MLKDIVILKMTDTKVDLQTNQNKTPLLGKPGTMMSQEQLNNYHFIIRILMWIGIGIFILTIVVYIVNTIIWIEDAVEYIQEAMEEIAKQLE